MKKNKEISEILNNKEVVNLELQEVSNDFAQLLNDYNLISKEQFHPLKILIELFDEKKIIIPQELNKSLFYLLIDIQDNFIDSEDFVKDIDNCLEIVDALGLGDYY
ncbi:hypothetical protein A3306_03760 [Rickettsia bellii]|uniref:Uncharacterized protein n=2 Tax=Rickettsia bellii TaxID=33990 RepID=A0A0F3QLF0_RICBE|nr:hypothetical protein [Rickettsia bellii]ABV79538.1 hypothetical protein A1I_06090 [Rickettsia bellii OSU 85-389]ARD86321.1 hypothetical protein A3306_03760 [Rickettsia bellii]KJV90119.1 hypothetical protein RBEAN4_1121 [Rickettsia bellii str. RML An4]KJV92259.1 hypothetical protein RBEMOGI_0887 [Rickettsia bellii str. RML Mogi]